jgi:hypothetical protein
LLDAPQHRLPKLDEKKVASIGHREIEAVHVPMMRRRTKKKAA